MGNDNKALKPVDTALYGYWSAVFLSFFSRRLYVDVGRRWSGLGFIYLLLVIALLALPLSLRVGMKFDKSFNDDIIGPMAKLPVLYVQNGQISINEPAPLFIKNSKGEVVIVVDPTGKVNQFTSEYPKLNLLINKDVIYFRSPTPSFFIGDTVAKASNNEPFVQHLDKSMNTVFTGSQFITQQSISNLKIASMAMIYPVVLLSIYSFFMVIFPALALLAQSFSSIFFTFQLTYKQASRLLIVSATPMLFLLFAFLSLQFSFFGMGLFLLSVMVAYFTYALRTFKAESMRIARL